MRRGVLVGGVNLLESLIASIFKFSEVAAVLLNEGDGSLEVADLGGASDPWKLDGLECDVRQMLGRHRVAIIIYYWH